MLAAAGGSPPLGLHTSDWLLLAVVVILVFLSGFFALSETAITRMSVVRATALVEQGRRGARALKGLVERTDQILPVVLFTLEVCTLVAATLVGVVAGDVLGALGVVVATAFEIVVIFVLAELAPKTWAVQHTERAALLCAPVIAALVRFPPLRWVTRALIAAANVVLPGKGIKQGPYVSEQELLAMADTAADEAVIEREERRLIHSIIGFGDTVVREVMVPRTDMVVVESRARIGDVMDIAMAAGFSRVPVYGQGIDDIIGIVYLKDLVAVERENRADERVTSILREAKFVPETKRVPELMREMQQTKQHIAIVVDEYGGTAGLVTLEDAIEELIGEIVDEYDVEEAPLQRLADGAVRVNARTPLDQVNELLGIDLPEGDWDSIGGLLSGLLGHVPAEKEGAECDGHRLVAEEVAGHRIGYVRIDAQDGGGAEAGEEAPDGGDTPAGGDAPAREDAPVAPQGPAQADAPPADAPS